MPVTPSFTCSQDAEYVFLAVRVPWVRVAGMEFAIDGRDFSFYCKPYLLKLTFPGGLVDDERARGVYDVSKDNGTITLHLPKSNPGEVFPDLDLLTRLRTPAPFSLRANKARTSSSSSSSSPPSSSSAAAAAASAGRPLIQVVSSASSSVPGDAGPDGDYYYSGEDEDDENASSSDGDAAAGDGGGGGQSASAAAATAAAAAAAAASATATATPSSETARRVPLVVGDAGAVGGAGGGVRLPTAAGADLGEGEGAAVLLPGAVRYGFHNRLSGFFAPLRSDFPELVRLPDPDRTPAAARRALQAEEEDASFDRFRYMSDFLTAHEDPMNTLFQEYSVARLLADRNNTDDKRSDSGGGKAGGASGGSAAAAAADGAVVFNEVERRAMQELPNEEFLIDAGSAEARELMHGLLEMLTAFAYDCRQTQGEFNTESGWTIATLSATLSWLVTFRTPGEALRSAVRRILTFPYLRLWECAELAVRDAVAVLARGRRAVLRCLLAARDVLAHDEQRYLLNRMFLDGYCVWLQSAAAVPDAFLAAYAAEAREAAAQLKRSTLGPVGGVTLPDLEAEAVQLAAMSDDDDEEEEGGGGSGGGGAKAQMGEAAEESSSEASNSDDSDTDDSDTDDDSSDDDDDSSGDGDSSGDDAAVNDEGTAASLRVAGETQADMEADLARLAGIVRMTEELTGRVEGDGGGGGGGGAAAVADHDTDEALSRDMGALRIGGELAEPATASARQASRSVAPTPAGGEGGSEPLMKVVSSKRL